MRRQVAIIADPLAPLVKAVAAGIGEQAQAEYQWQFHLFWHNKNGFESLFAAKIDGAIAIGMLDEDAHALKTLQRLSIPLVHAGELHRENEFHQVTMPNVAVGALGARHFLERGLRHFAFVGDDFGYARGRCRGFVQALAEAGYDRVGVFRKMNKPGAALAEFIQRLPLPVGVMASSDGVGWSVADDAFRLGLQIPESIALLGVGNDDPWCALSTPPMSSIGFPTRSMGLQAAAALNDLMNGRPVPLRLDIASDYVAERHSTDVMHTDNREIAAGIRFMRQRKGVGISAWEVAEYAGVSRSTLERGVKLLLGRTPLQEIHRLRLEGAKELLANSDLPMKVIAVRSGFINGKRFATEFRSAIGLTPSQYRNDQKRIGPVREKRKPAK